MARVNYGGLVTEFNGSIGGTVFQKNKYGYTAKNTPNMKRPNSQSVFSVQRILNTVTQSWSDLSPEDRLAFETYAATYPQFSKHNPTAILSGYAIYVKWQCTRLNVGLPLGAVPPSLSVVFPSIAPVIENESSTLSIFLNLASPESNAAYGIYLSPPVRASLNYPPSSCRLLGYMITTSEGPDFTAKVISIFGALPAVGKTLFLKVVPFGLVTPQVQSAQFFKLVVE